MTIAYPNLIQSSDLGFSYGGKPIIERVNIKLVAGEVVTIIGPNGAGKTTLLRLLLGSLCADHGSILRAPSLVVGYVPQRSRFTSTIPLTVGRFLSLPTKRDDSDKLEALDQVDLKEVMEQRLTSLSGGQMQRVMVARALLGAPNLLILDEPTQGMDQQSTSSFYLMLDRLRKDLSCAILMASHDLHVVMSTSDRVICLNHHVCCSGAPSVVATRPEYRALFGRGTKGSLAMYRHEHNHSHDETSSS